MLGKVDINKTKLLYDELVLNPMYCVVAIKPKD